ncbi:hypothetical protein LG045_04750 [Limosilactobacillus gastricus]|uniref:citrate lyase holo-[acyl-carrier protein] synthase n=1 Tax=Limosilactobacillus gastricus TaxID=227942 RepID=UPI001299819F|nr:citrate lyase holo-[acyl-carrier protein] synthase [Limosilactobacillus gastricus]QGF40462.1 hypothetical protein LG045_04750 [Limosilactobacillus gastricus]
MKIPEIFATGQEVDTQTIREHAHARFQELSMLVSSNPDWTVVSVALNIPGSIKTNQLIQDFFQNGVKRFENSLIARDLLSNVSCRMIYRQLVLNAAILLKEIHS